MQRITSLKTVVMEKNGSKNSPTSNSSSSLTSVLRKLSDMRGGGKRGVGLDETLTPEQFQGNITSVRVLGIG